MAFLVVSAVLISGCSGITQTQAEAKALEFVNQNVKFFAKVENSTLNLPQYNVSSVNSHQENKNWVVIVHIFAELDNSTKKNDLVIKLNSKGDITEFNGKKVPE